MIELIYKDLSYQLNGIFFSVQNKLGAKFQEKHYQRAICSLLKKADIPFRAEVAFDIEFDGEKLGSFRADLIIDNKILIELKTVDGLTIDHKRQIQRYLDALDLKLALLINFKNVLYRYGV